MTKITTDINVKDRLTTAQADAGKSLKNQKIDTPQEVDKAASGFEALLLHNMLQEMWSTTGSEGILGDNSNEAQIFRDMFHQAISDEIAEGDGIGVKNFLKKELSKYKDPASN